MLIRRLAGGYNSIIRSKLSDINGMINESIQEMSIIRVFRRQRKMAEEFKGINGDLYSYQMKLLKLNSWTSHNLVNVIRNVIFLSVIWLFSGRYAGSAVTVGVCTP